MHDQTTYAEDRFSCDEATKEHNMPKIQFLILYVPVNNFSVMSGWVFLG